MVAKMNLIFDKEEYEKGQAKLEKNKTVVAVAGISSASTSTKDNDDKATKHDGAIVKRALLESLATGKVGSLTVDPNYLDFEALECN